MKTVRKFLVLLLSLLLAVGMAACGQTVSPGDDGDDPGTVPETPVDSEGRYKVDDSEWDAAAATLYEGLTMTVKAIEIGDAERQSLEDIADEPLLYEDYTVTGTESDETMVTLRFDGNRLLLDWNDALEERWASNRRVFDSAFERVWNDDEEAYNYYCYLKDDTGALQASTVDYGTVGDLDRNLDSATRRPSYLNSAVSTGSYTLTVTDPNAWWYKDFVRPFSDMLTDIACDMRTFSDMQPKAAFDETTDSYKIAKAVMSGGVLYADESGYTYDDRADLLIQNLEIKFDNGKCLSLSYDAYELADNQRAFSVEAVRSTDFVTLPDGGHGRGLAYAERAEAMDNAAAVINNAVQPTNFTKTVTVTPDKNNPVAVGESNTFKVTETAVHIHSRVYTGEAEAGDYDDSLWVETETYNSKESDGIYYYSLVNGSWEKQPDAGLGNGNVNDYWTEIQETWYVSVGTRDDETPVAPSDLVYDAENDIYWSPSGHCIRVGEQAMWSHMSYYSTLINYRAYYIFVSWSITDMGSTEVTLPQAD